MHFKRKSNAIIPDYLKYNIKMLMKHKLFFLRLAYTQLFEAVFKFWFELDSKKLQEILKLSFEKMPHGKGRNDSKDHFGVIKKVLSIQPTLEAKPHKNVP